MDNTTVENWNIQDTWNELVTTEPSPTPRSYIRASELGAPFLDRFLRMKGIAPTNPFSNRIKRVFDCGNIFEEVVERVFRLCGILIDGQETVKVELPGMLPVIGHYDHKVGGIVQIDKVRKLLDKSIFDAVLKQIKDLDSDIAEFLEFMYPASWLRERSLRMAEQLAAQYPNGMKILIAECKSVNSRAFWSHRNQDPMTGFFKGYEHHKLQLYTYLLGTEYDEGRRFYVSKDDLTLMESPVHKNDLVIAELWKEDVATMTKYYNLNTEPPKEEDIIYDEEKQVYVSNWLIARSSYFTRITGFRTVEEWEISLRPQLKKLNTKACKGCQKDFMLVTLNKNGGYCLKCSKKKGGVENE